MINILCFGDSNTWGYAPVTGMRYPWDIRWTGALQDKLGSGYRIIEEGLNGRTSGFDEPERDFRNAAQYFPMLLECHRPLELVVIMLGTNDLKSVFNLNAQEIALSVKGLCEMVLNNDYKENANTRVLLVSPTHVVKPRIEDDLVFLGARDKSVKFALEYQKVADALGIFYLDASEIITTTDADGLHWTAQQHQDFSAVLRDKILSIFSN
ncbi:SGNH/GDSL hydrolase family protein [Shewanella violacea]|uniref:Arylesterase, putative n=1 Tax=Shewanella violacea (strain JCM 10179 / CIP 106290 / LMG 19151 / DSS12) TaxID=637905 RepID=D4ZBZ8_SHEVD|nr:SGNH/GDSL hydrolase family protein [Shewanella violacea]BAJ03543.1 arylesterase, putative [Shewanella violacea DSS12]